MLRKLKFVVLSILLFVLGSFQNTNEMKEETIKAMFLYNFTKHFEWPAGTDEKEIVIGVYGSEKTRTALLSITKNKNSYGKNISVREITGWEDIAGCHIVFISNSAFHHMENERQRLEGKPVLLVTEEMKMPPNGIAVNIIRIGDKFRFELNESVIKTSGLKASKQLISFALNNK